jgi:signal transduction histidine kinase
MTAPSLKVPETESKRCAETPVTRKGGEGNPIELPGGGAGEGIGLSIVKVLCRLLGAGLELENEPGRGLTFRLTFPCHYAKDAA